MNNDLFIVIAAPVGTLIVGLATIWFGRKASKETNLTDLLQVVDSRSNTHIDQLQEDVDRYRKMAIENEELMDKARKEARDERHRRINAEAGEKAAKVIIERLEQENAALKETITTLENTIERIKASQGQPN